VRRRREAHRSSPAPRIAQPIATCSRSWTKDVSGATWKRSSATPARSVRRRRCSRSVARACWNECADSVSQRPSRGSRRDAPSARCGYWTLLYQSVVLEPFTGKQCPRVVGVVPLGSRSVIRSPVRAGASAVSDRSTRARPDSIAPVPPCGPASPRTCASERTDFARWRRTPASPCRCCTGCRGSSRRWRAR
jgi:hypothetical protein